MTPARAEPVARLVAAYEPSPLWDRGIEVLEWAIGLPIFKLLSAVVLVVGMLVTASVPRLRSDSTRCRLTTSERRNSSSLSTRTAPCEAAAASVRLVLQASTSMPKRLRRSTCAQRPRPRRSRP